jgi:hypothetical protein
MNETPEHLALQIDQQLADSEPEPRTHTHDAYPPEFLDGAVELVAAILAKTTGAKPRPLPASQLPDWIRLSALAEMTRWVDGQAQSLCTHRPNPAAHEPAVTAAWAPGLVTCHRSACIDTLRRTARETCDGCGNRATTRVRTVVMGIFGYQMRACTDCAVPGLDDGDCGLVWPVPILAVDGVDEA